MKLRKKGAEADIYQSKWQNSKAILKIRKIKNYRNPSLDSKIRKQRTIKESQIIISSKVVWNSNTSCLFCKLGKSYNYNARNSWKTSS